MKKRMGTMDDPRVDFEGSQAFPMASFGMVRTVGFGLGNEYAY